MTIKQIIGVASCKGGVGKSTLAVNLSVLFSIYHKLKVGLLDADIYGPNHPSILGVSNKLPIEINKKMLLPKNAHNVSSMSMGYFLKNDAPVLLRGPMVSNTIKYLFEHTDWGNLDILIIDFPPGTGDIYLSILRDIKINGVFLVTTPNISSIEDVGRSISMFKKFNIPILGLLENMKYYKCAECNNLKYIFGNNNKVILLAKNKNIPIYEFPINEFVNKSLEKGKPFVIDNNLCKNIFLILNNIAKTLI